MSGIACFIVRNGALEIDPYDELEVLLREFRQRPHHAIDPSAVEQDVQAAVGLAHLRHQAGDTAGIGHVEPDGPAALSEQRSGLLGTVQVGADDTGALLRQPGGDCGAGARTRTRHDGNLIVEPAHGLPCSNGCPRRLRTAPAVGQRHGAVAPVDARPTRRRYPLPAESGRLRRPPAGPALSSWRTPVTTLTTAGILLGCRTTPRSTRAPLPTTGAVDRPTRRSSRLFSAKGWTWMGAAGSSMLAAAPASSPSESPTCSRRRSASLGGWAGFEWPASPSAGSCERSRPRGLGSC